MIWPISAAFRAGGPISANTRPWPQGKSWKWRAPTWKCCPPAMQCPRRLCRARAQRLVGVQRRHGPQPCLLAAHQPDARVHAGDQKPPSATARAPWQRSPSTLPPDAGTGTGPAGPRPACPIYITHTKPSETELIMDEIRNFDVRTPHGFDAPHDIRWLQAGMCWKCDAAWLCCTNQPPLVVSAHE